MKWLAFLLVVFAVTVSALSSATLAASSGLVAIESISHAAGSEASEQLIFKLSEQIAPKIMMMKGNNPRLVLDFANSKYSGKDVIPLADGKLATAVRIGFHQTPEQKTRVVIDLAKDIAVSHTMQYSEADHHLVVELSAASAQAPKKEVVKPVAREVAAPQPPPENVQVAPPVAEKPVQPEPPPPKKEDKKTAAAPVAPAAAAAPAKGPQLTNITFDDSSRKGEMVLFHLTDFHPPTVSAVEKDNPKVICDFAGMSLGQGVEENIVANGKFVERITTTKHSNPDKIRVVLNLFASRDYDLQQVFFKKDNLFVLIINEMPPDKPKN